MYRPCHYARRTVVSVVTTGFTVRLVFGTRYTRLRIGVCHVKGARTVSSAHICERDFTIELYMIIDRTDACVEGSFVRAILIMSSGRHVRVRRRVSIRVRVIRALFMMTIVRLDTFRMIDAYVVHVSSYLGTTVLRACSRSQNRPFTSNGVRHQASALTGASYLVVVSGDYFNAATCERGPVAPRQVDSCLVFVLGLSGAGFFRGFDLLLHRNGEERADWDRWR